MESEKVRAFIEIYGYPKTAEAARRAAEEIRDSIRMGQEREALRRMDLVEERILSGEITEKHPLDVFGVCLATKGFGV